MAISVVEHNALLPTVEASGLPLPDSNGVLLSHLREPAGVHPSETGTGEGDVQGGFWLALNGRLVMAPGTVSGKSRGIGAETPEEFAISSIRTMPSEASP
jgi:hypothetical protein